MKIVILILCSLGVPVLLHSQASDQNVIAADGGTAVSRTMTIDWTLGEPVTESVRTTKQWYTQGFQQPLLTIKDMQPQLNANNTSRSAQSEITAAPNPVTTMLTLTINNVPDNEIVIQISNVSGQIVKAESIDPTLRKTDIDLSSLASGLYMLRIYNSKQQLL